MAASSRAQVLALYRALLREGRRFGAYSYRTYALRRIRDAFREHKSVRDPREIQSLVDRARRDLGVIQRQVQVGRLYMADRLIIEGQDKTQA
ncbi:LYR motif-containing protein 4 [Sorex fumeus]|uniref:LYR motif-containing protein 4 n=1 Tax=Sorex fumeus TaxID=62283 RepID=UPI0024AC90F6|nr:LYR motif-containing protein 4 [Sorex fumeus]